MRVMLHYHWWLETDIDNKEIVKEYAELLETSAEQHIKEMYAEGHINGDLYETVELPHETLTFIGIWMYTKE